MILNLLCTQANCLVQLTTAYMGHTVARLHIFS